MDGDETRIKYLGWLSSAQTMYYKFTNAGDYYIRIYGEVNLTPLQIQYTLIQPDAYENNDVWKKATPMVKDTPMQFTLTADNDEDYFKVTVPSADQTIKITVDKADGGQFEDIIHADLYDGKKLMDGDETRIKYLGWLSSAQTMEYKLTNAGDYYIRIYGGVNLTPLTIQSNFGYPGAVIKTVPSQNTTDFIYDTEDPGVSVTLPTDKLDIVTDKTTAVSAIQSAISGMEDEQKVSATGVDLVTLYAEAAVAQAASKTVKGGDIVIDQASVQELQTTAAEVKSAAEQTLVSSKITTKRNLNADVKFKTSESASVKITIDTSAANLSVDNVRVETPVYAVSLSAESIKANAKDSPLVITITESSSSAALPIDANTILASAESHIAYSLNEGIYSDENSMLLAAVNAKTYQITFNKTLTENIKVALPPAQGDPTYQAVVDSSGKAVGGKYNPVTKTIDVKIKNSDTYTVKENKKDFTDIVNKTKEMQNAITVLASKGIINGISETSFAPDLSITRAEIAALIVRTLSKYDPDEDGGFSDVPRSAWYFGVAGSAKKHGIMVGNKDIFFPLDTIPKDQITAVAARVLRNEMKYKDPEDVNKELSVYTDVTSLAEWSRTDIALATRENLVVRRYDGKFDPTAKMTRGDAAIILYRMFMKIW